MDRLPLGTAASFVRENLSKPKDRGKLAFGRQGATAGAFKAKREPQKSLSQSIVTFKDICISLT
ncbi:MAG: hypothetical protein HQ511_11645 [Rhodospirillales bacterium]|nr:hypothetical protein [Rhodospirillales bacterium]